MRNISLFLLLGCLAGPLQAARDPLLTGFASSQLTGSVEVSLGLREYIRDAWLDDQMQPVKVGGHIVMTDADGVSKSVKGFRFELAVAWQAGPRDLVRIALPYYNTEFSKWGGSYTPWDLSDPTVRRADASGDLSLAWRHGLLTSDAWRVYAALQLSAPTGQGPFNSAHPLIATGQGDFGAQPAVGFEGAKGDLPLWLELCVPLELGYAADIEKNSFIAFQDGTTTAVTLPAARAWMDRGPSYVLKLGLGYHWYHSEIADHQLSLEAQWSAISPLRLDGHEVALTRQQSLDVVPQASFHFHSGLSALVGWQLPLGLASNRAAAYWGEALLRIDYRL